TGAAPAGDGEVELAGPRVAGGRVVALWDRGLRYLPRRAGYHGGASLAEMTVPVLAFLHLGAAAPRTWKPLPPDPYPAWWSAPVEVAPAAPDATAPAPVPRPRAAGKPAPADQPLFDLAPAPSLVDAVLESEMFAAQRALTPRTVPLPKVRGALAALVEANGVLPAVVVAQRAGEQPERANGFITTLPTLFNVDSYPVLSRTGDVHTVRLNLALLLEQFDVPQAARCRYARPGGGRSSTRCGAARSPTPAWTSSRSAWTGSPPRSQRNWRRSPPAARCSRRYAASTARARPSSPAGWPNGPSGPTSPPPRCRS